MFVIFLHLTIVISTATTLPEIKPSKMRSWDISSIIRKTSFNSHDNNNCLKSIMNSML